MKDYMSEMTSQEMAEWIVEYIKETGWHKGEHMNLSTLEDIIVYCDKGQAIITLYFDHPNRQYELQESIEYESIFPDLKIKEKIHMVFYGDSYSMGAIDMYPTELRKYAFEESKSVAQDINRFWQSKMYNKFKESGYLEDLQTVEQEKLNQPKVNREYDKSFDEIEACPGAWE